MPIHVPNARKVYNFKIEILGLSEQFECQKVTFPEMSIDQVKHGDANYDVKTAGRFNIENIKIEKLKRMPGTEIFGWLWLMQAQNPQAGGGGLAQNYYRTIVIRELGPSGLFAVNTWTFDGCWVCKVGQTEFSRTESANIIQTLEISVNLPGLF